MQQSTLNLIAITIFVLTMSSLLGPIIHLSPFVPALTAFGLLGVATLDQFSWQGQGGNLLTEWVAGISSDRQERVLHHEAGHFLVAHLLGIPVTGYTLSTWEALKQGINGQGGVVFDLSTLDQDLAQGKLSEQVVNQYGRVWMAGTEAESLVYGNAIGGTDDQQKFKTLWTQLGRPAAEGQLKQRWSALQARTLIENNWSAYEALVKAMADRESIIACTQVIEENRSIESTA